MKRDFRYVGQTEAYMKRKKRTAAKNERDGHALIVFFSIAVGLVLLTAIG